MAKTGRKLINFVGQIRNGWVVVVQEDKKLFCKCVTCDNRKTLNRQRFSSPHGIKKCENCSKCIEDNKPDQPYTTEIKQKYLDLVGSVKSGWKVLSIDNIDFNCQCVTCGKLKTIKRWCFTQKSYKLRECLKCYPRITGESLKRNQEIKDLLDSPENPTLEEVAKKYGITKERVRQIYKKLTGESRGYSYRYERNIGKSVGVFTVKCYDEEKNKYYLECSNGHKKLCGTSYWGILRNYGCSQCTREKVDKRVSERNEKLYNLYLAGVKISDIAKEFATTSGCIDQILVRYYPNRLRRKKCQYTEKQEMVNDQKEIL